MRVYHRGQAARPARVVWTLEELGQPYELVVLSAQEGSGEEHRRRHPLGRVPVLEDAEGPVFESAAICMHLADLHPEGGLLPAPGTHDRALAYQWACFAPAQLEPPIEVMRLAEGESEHVAAARDAFAACVEAVSDVLGDGDYLVAGGFGVADVLVGTALAYTVGAGFMQLPGNLSGYLARLAQRPAYLRTVERLSG